MKLIRNAATGLLGLVLVTPASAQQPLGPEHIARIIAVVGDSVITNFDLQERILAFQANLRQSNRPIPQPGSPEFEQLTQEVLEDRISELLLVQAALRDTTLAVSEQELTAGVDRHLNNLRRQLGGDDALERALLAEGRTLASYRETLMQQQRSRELISRYMRAVQSRRKAPPVTEAEVRQVFDAAEGRVPMLPAMITFEQVVLMSQPSDSALTAAKMLADSIHDRILAKEDFAALARRYSQDPGSRELGGDLGWFRTGIMYREFEQVAFSPLMRPGDVSRPVRTPFGYHIIKLERIRGPERQARHILIRPEITDADVERTRVRASELGDRLRRGEATMADLIREHHDQDEESRIGPFPRDSLPEPYDEQLAQATDGQVIGPIRLQGATGSTKWVVVKVTRVEPERPATLADYREQIRANLAEQKLSEEILEELRRRMHVEIRIAGDPPHR